MRSLYSTSSGNPDLLGESGTSLEFAATWNGPVYRDGDGLLQPLQGLHRHHPSLAGGTTSTSTSARPTSTASRSRPRRSCAGSRPRSTTPTSTTGTTPTTGPSTPSPRTTSTSTSRSCRSGPPGRLLRPAGLEVLVVEHPDNGHAARDPVLLQPGRDRQLTISRALPGLRQARQHLRRLFLHRAGLPLAGTVLRGGSESGRLEV